MQRRRDKRTGGDGWYFCSLIYLLLYSLLLFSDNITISLNHFITIISYHIISYHIISYHTTPHHTTHHPGCVGAMAGVYGGLRGLSAAEDVLAGHAAATLHDKTGLMDAAAENFAEVYGQKQVAVFLPFLSSFFSFLFFSFLFFSFLLFSFVICLFLWKYFTRFFHCHFFG